MLTPLQVLVVEDSDRDTTLLVRVLRQGGYAVTFERVDSAEGLAAALEASAWDLIISDFSMPGFSAPAALRQVRARGLDLPFIIVSGTISRDTAVQMMQDGAQDFLAKDDLARLLPAVARELRAAAERHARRTAQEALRSSEERFRLLFAANPQPMWVHDLQSLTFLEVNDAAIAQYGYPRVEFLQMGINDILPPDAVVQLLEDVQPPVEGAVWAGKLQHRCRDGRIIDVEVAACTLHFAGGAVGLTVATDITARIQALNTLEQARAAAEELAGLRSDFVAMVSHELRTPLTVIAGCTQILQEYWQDLSPTKQLDHIVRIGEAAHRLRRLVEDLLLLSRLETRALPPVHERVSLALLLQQAAYETQASYGGQCIELIGSADVQVLADSVRTVQVLANLMDNAAKYSPEDSSMTVSWGVEGGMAVVRVHDCGQGVSEQGRKYLFTRFGRVPGSIIRPGRGGTGLGLFIGRQLAETMGGDLDLEATGPEGSTFRLRLPLVSS